jgi:hypothetical protein
VIQIELWDGTIILFAIFTKKKAFIFCILFICNTSMLETSTLGRFQETDAPKVSRAFFK